jgi:hypothetical protein
MKKVIMFCVLFTFMFVLTSCNKAIPLEKQCTLNSDCVPSVCCHATDSVNEDHGPDCSKTLCSLECKPGTIDCGQGAVACVEGSCKVIMR